MRRLIPVVVAAIGLAGCAATSSTTPDAPIAASTTEPARPSHAPRAAHTTGVPVSSASSITVQPQPPAGSCHARGTPPFALPDRRCTPGAISPAVTQAKIDSTICRRGYTKTVRPAESITATEKLDSMAAYGDHAGSRDYEYDHLVSLELGGAPNDPRNLWPQPGASPNTKDRLEDRLRELVCGGQLTLASAQRQIATNWVLAYRRLFGGA